jgi:hypothetical protein
MQKKEKEENNWDLVLVTLDKEQDDTMVSTDNTKNICIKLTVKIELINWLI